MPLGFSKLSSIIEEKKIEALSSVDLDVCIEIFRQLIINEVE